MALFVLHTTGFGGFMYVVLTGHLMLYVQQFTVESQQFLRAELCILSKAAMRLPGRLVQAVYVW